MKNTSGQCVIIIERLSDDHETGKKKQKAEIMKMRFLDQIPYICEQWAELAARSPSSPFITEEVSGRSFTRQQVDELSARVYGWLLAKEIGTEDFVMIRFPRDARPFIAMLGVWKTGAAFTVVEDNYAPERTEAIRGDCGCRLVIDTASWEEILKTEPAAGYREADPHDACFAIYTSGSTGKPKGVLQEYGKIKLNQASLEANPGDLIDETTCMAETAPLGFIAAVKIFMNALYSGMRLVVFSTDTAKNPVQMNRKFDEYHVNLAFLSPSILRIMTDGVSGSLKTLVTGSEAADGIYFDNVKLINNYGMSEAGFHVAQFVIDRRYDITPIGKPVFGDIQIKLLNEDGKAVPDGEAGEICFDNPFFRGYINMPEETEKVMRDGIFHTGDMGKRLPDGNIVVTGRKNTMVKIKGNRVEPEEIEACMRRILWIRDAAVRDFADEKRRVYLCGYYTLKKGAEEGSLCDKTVLIRQMLKRMLPHYMIPAFFIEMDEMPLNRNGKIDRLALPKPDAGAMGREYTAPGTPEEKAICEVFEKVLSVERVGATDDFFELGGDSLSTALAAAELEALQVDYKDICAYKTPRKIAERLPEKDLADLDALTEAELAREQHLTPYQIYFYDAILYSPKQTGLNNPISMKLSKKAVDAERLKAALERVFSHYAIFSTVLSFNEEGEPVMRYVPGNIVRPEIIRVSEYNADKLREIIRPYRLKGELLYRCRIYETPEHVVLEFDSCHLISDGAAMANFMSELWAAYRGEALRKDHYYYYLQEQYRRQMELEQEADTMLLIDRFNRPDCVRNLAPDLRSRRTGNGRYHASTSRTLAECRKACEKLHTSLNKLFVASALIALSKHSGSAEVCVEWTFNGRDENWKKDLIGITLSSVPVAADMSAIHTPGQLLDEIDRENELGMRYSALSLGNKGVTPGEFNRLTVVYESGFDMTGLLPEDTEVAFGYDLLDGVFTRCQFIIFDGGDLEDPISFYINYDSNLYSAGLIADFCKCFDEALGSMISGEPL